MMKEHHKCSASRDYTHRVYPTSLRAPNQKSSGKKMDSDPGSSSTTTCVWWRNSNPVHPPNKGSPLKEGERGRERSTELICIFLEYCVLKKGHPPHLYIGGKGATQVRGLA